MSHRFARHYSRWEQGEDDVEFWHDLESGYAGRHKL
jgi:hypothetical protein